MIRIRLRGKEGKGQVRKGGKGRMREWGRSERKKERGEKGMV